mmetsp:Transcript_7889/g.17395  ORF Transcript_7889/g.17395 Transcript_7889/m.17395 type:complete len:819 (-) Transcript_7889:96-2552(-)
MHALVCRYGGIQRLVWLCSFGSLLWRQAHANWLLQCSSCVDQAYFGDESLKENVRDADLPSLLAQLKRVRLRQFDHREDEFYNKFFSKTQLGVIAQEVQNVMPGAVALLPERRWTNSKGMSNATKNVLMLRDSHLLFVAVGALQIIAGRAEYWDSTIEKLEKQMVAVVEEQNDNRKKREDILEQLVRVVAKVEVLQHVLSKTEEGFAKLEADMKLFRQTQEERFQSVMLRLDAAMNRTDAQDANIEQFKAEFREAVEREAREDLVEKRKAAEAEVEVEKIKKQIEEMRWQEEQKTIQMREDEKRKSDDHSSKLHQERTAFEVAQKKAADLEMMSEQEASNLRQEAAKREGEKELLQLKLQSDEKVAELKLQEAIEAAKLEQEAKIREKRENEDVNLRALRAEMAEKRQQTLAAIKATADIAMSWISSFYGSPQNLILGLASVIICLGGVYLMREMAILLREQLNKRLGRPSLVRMTNRRGFFQQMAISVLRLLRLLPKHGSEFNDVVLHPKLHNKVMRLAESTRSAKRRNMPLQHVMFYGPPGTGKTMVAQRFAEYSGLEYAIMSGGDVAPLQEQAVTELHKLFKWVHRSRKGVLLFIDEADAYLSSRKNANMSEALRNALTTMLYHTGTPSSQFMMVLATNRPHDLDSAVLDRIDESVEFGLPDLDARIGMVKLYFDKFVTKPLQISVLTKGKNGEIEEPAGVSSASGLRRRFGRTGSKPTPSKDAANGPPEPLVEEGTLVDTARRLHGFSGREISKLFTSLQSHILYSDRRGDILHYLPFSIFNELIDQKVHEHATTADFNIGTYEYQHKEPAPPA